MYNLVLHLAKWMFSDISLKVNDITYSTQFVAPSMKINLSIHSSTIVLAPTTFIENNCLHELFSLACSSKRKHVLEGFLISPSSLRVTMPLAQCMQSLLTVYLFTSVSANWAKRTEGQKISMIGWSTTGWNWMEINKIELLKEKKKTFDGHQTMVNLHPSECNQYLRKLQKLYCKHYGYFP